MTKSIVLLFDGTANTIRENRTNVLRLHGCLTKDSQQLVWYSPGVGTFAGDRSFFSFTITPKEVFGMLSGLGVDYYAKQAYRFLCENYDDGRRSDGPDVPPDKVFLFGFSRGAYIARVLAGFLNAFGMIPKRNLNLLDQAFVTYKGLAERPPFHPDEAWEQMELWHRALSPRPVPIECLGLFDTVSSVFEIGRDFLRFRTNAFTSENPSVKAVRHAIALDDRRGPYHPVRWRESCKGTEEAERTAYYGQRFAPYDYDGAQQDIREMWFAGVHSAVGGGISEQHSQLAKIALDWMIQETSAMGVRYDQKTVDCIVHGIGEPACERYVAPSALGPTKPPSHWLAEPLMRLGWGLTNLMWRRIEPCDAPFRRVHITWRGREYYFPIFSNRRLVRPHDLIHSSVRERQEQRELASPNLPAEPNYSD